MTDRDNYNKIFENGRAHIQSAKLLASQKEYGFATSHLILGLEELVKYYLVQIHSVDDSIFTDNEMKQENRKSIFRNHQTKHHLLKEFQEAISPDFSETFIEYLFFKSIGKELEEKHIVVQNNRFKEIGSFFGIAYSEINIPDNEKSEFYDWLKSANDLKNQCFYAHLSGNTIETPKDITSKTYETSLRYTSAILKQILVLKELDITEDEFIDFLNSDLPVMIKNPEEKKL